METEQKRRLTVTGCPPKAFLLNKPKAACKILTDQRGEFTGALFAFELHVEAVNAGRVLRLSWGLSLTGRVKQHGRGEG